MVRDTSVEKPLAPVGQAKEDNMERNLPQYQRSGQPLSPDYYQSKRNGGKITGIVIGAVLLFGRLIGPAIPVYHGHTFDQAHAVCSSALGSFISAFSVQAAHDCTAINILFTVGNLAAIGGAILMISCIIALIMANQKS